jgi:hypothetical protein
VYIGESSLDDFSAQVLTHNTFTYYSTVEWIVNLQRKIIKKKISEMLNDPHGNELLSTEGFESFEDIRNV